MFRTIRVLAVILSVLFIAASCNENSTTEDESGIIEDSKEMTESIDYDAVFESVSIEREDFKLERLQVDGTLVGVLKGTRVLMEADSKLFIYDYENGNTVDLAEGVWNPAVSQNKNYILYENDDGIYLVNSDDLQKKRIYSLEGEISRNFIVSYDDNYILIQTVKGDEYISKFVDLEGNELDYRVEEDDNFVITKLVALNDDKLYAVVKVKDITEFSEEEVLEESTDLVSIDLKNNYVKNITNLNSQDEISVLDMYDDGKLVLKIVENTINEEGVTSNISMKKVNTSNGGVYNLKIRTEDPQALKMIDDNRYIWLEEPEKLDYDFPDKVIIKYVNGSDEIDVGEINSDVPSKMFVQDDRMIFYSNGDLYVMTIPTD